MADLLDYNTSILNPALKIVIALIFLLVAGIFYDVRNKYGGEVRSFVICLFYFAIFVFLASVARYFGDGIEFGFTKDYSLKWFQSIGYMISAIIYVLAGSKILKLLKDDQT